MLLQFMQHVLQFPGQHCTAQQVQTDIQVLLGITLAAAAAMVLFPAAAAAYSEQPLKQRQRRSVIYI
jgi:hypothetical protein